MSENKIFVKRSYVAELFVASSAAAGGLGCLIYGLASISSLMTRLAEDPVRAIQSETGIFVFGGILLLIAGVLLYIFTPSGFCVDPVAGEVRTWRGLYPRLKMQRFPLAGSEIFLLRQTYHHKGVKNVFYQLMLEMPEGRTHGLHNEEDREAVWKRGLELADQLGLPLTARQ